MDIFNVNAGFNPFYGDMVAVEGLRASRTERGSYAACIFDNGIEEPIAEGDTSNNRRNITVQISRTDKGWLTGGPQKGDVITLECGTKFKVKNVSALMNSDWLMEAREV